MNCKLHNKQQKQNKHQLSFKYIYEDNDRSSIRLQINKIISFHCPIRPNIDINRGYRRTGGTAIALLPCRKAPLATEFSNIVKALLSQGAGLFIFCSLREGLKREGDLVIIQGKRCYKKALF